MQWSGYLYDPPHSGHPPTFIEAALSASLAKALVSEAFPSNRNFIFYREQRVAQRLHLSPFDNQRQDAFTSRWFRHRHSTDFSKELMREVRAHHHDGVRIISRVPNLLCMMNMLKRSGKPLPDGRAALYDEIVKAYLGGIDAAYKMQPILGNTCPFEPAERRFLLSLLGALMQKIRLGSEKGDKDGNILIAMPELAQLLLPAIESMQQAGKVTRDHSATALLDELLHHIASRSGLLIPRSSDADGNTVYSFTHLSFLEFFAAEWLGKEFDRQRNRIVRRSLAAAEGQTLTEADLDHEFPPHGPVQHSLNSFNELPAIPAWHEPLIFLLESRKSDVPTLLRWLFPALHAKNQQSEIPKQNSSKPLLPLDAVKLAVQLAYDQELSLSPATRQSWWGILWSAQLTWPHSPWHPHENKRWAIAPVLLERAEHRTEILQVLADVLIQHQSHTLDFYGCKTLKSEDLLHFSQQTTIHTLGLADCIGLKKLPDLSGMEKLRELSITGCTGLDIFQTLQDLTKLDKLEKPHASRNPGLSMLPDLSPMKGLRRLSLWRCTELKSLQAIQPLTGLTTLEELTLSECTGLESLPDLNALRALRFFDLSGCTNLKGWERLKQQLHPKCKIIGPDGNEL